MSRLKLIGAKIARFFRKIHELYYKHPFLFCLVSALALNLIIEIICRHSFADAFLFIFEHPFMFLVGWVMLFFMFAISWVIPKGFALWLTLFIVWFALGVTNGVVLIYRAAPFAGSDFLILGSVLPIIGVYLNVFQIILCAAGIGGAITGLVFMWIKAPVVKTDIKRNVAMLLIFTVILAVLIPIFAVTGVFPSDFVDLKQAYFKYGYVYGFFRSVFFQGISEPDGYDSSGIDAIIQRLEAAKAASGNTESAERPNVIFVQLESFFDVNAVKDMSFSENPVPCFTALKEKYPNAFLTVPLIGAGTANTEFEVLTGMNLDYFGAGEFPYTSVLGDDTCESVAYLFSKYGYKTHAMHNNTGTFYDRDTVYANLGFDTFTPIECMYGVEYNALDWARDGVLTQQIMETLSSTDESDFVFTVSVQAHGKYPEELIGDEYGITVEGGLEEELMNMYRYYVNQLKGTDDFIKELTETLEAFSEPTAVLFYGDHLPYLELEEEQLSRGSLYQAEYVLWSKYGLEERVSEPEDIQSYQVNAFVFEALGLDGGIMGTAHTYLDGEEDYFDVLNTLEYDMLFGEKYAYGESGPYEPTDMSFGIRRVSVSSVDSITTGESGEKTILKVKGENFNEFSVIYVNGKRCDDTEYISETELRVVTKDISSGDTVTVVQEASDGARFGETAGIAVK